MKIDDEAKPTEDVSPTHEGEYSQEQLDEMLEAFVMAKQIEADPKKFAMLKDYATSKQKSVMELFDVNRIPAPKSLKDLKKIHQQKVMEEQGD